LTGVCHRPNMKEAWIGVVGLTHHRFARCVAVQPIDP